MGADLDKLRLSIILSGKNVRTPTSWILCEVYHRRKSCAWQRVYGSRRFRALRQRNHPYGLAEQRREVCSGRGDRQLKLGRQSEVHGIWRYGFPEVRELWR